MTVGDKLHQTLASMRSAKADMEAFAMDTKDKNAKKMYSNGAKQLGQLVNSLSGRTNYVEQQEPQYKTKKNQRGQQTTMQKGGSKGQSTTMRKGGQGGQQKRS